ncbi:helix-turn-helix transcriptional regulator [Streptomonospora sp. S1-112]|uniref:Helix-turn-helix transcriptional regulator n=1 Tax=Streptomonospora mangrovi TaxID=2883123 RepID=A0A9X3NQ77_9ACTN|nr:helix-turn-helix transcriptional regulator [Streptomonospora mangrovi]MDA0565944.1 helix-turn-helix transcriptional regulator [Streptomonospora mangrovi]
MAEEPREEWLRIGREIRRIRKSRDLSLDRLAERLPISAGMIGAMERGIRDCKPKHAEALDKALGTGDQLSSLVARVRPGTPWMAEVDPLLVQAEQIGQWQLAWVPGLLQTEAYARAAFRAGTPTANSERIEDSVHNRLRRQESVWSDPPPLARFVLDESVLLRTVGGATVMVGQLDHLLTMAENPHVSVQVLPLYHAPHSGMDGSFLLLHLPGGEVVLVLESRFAASVDHKEADVRRYRSGFEDLRALALSPPESADLIRRKRDQLAEE